MKQSEKQSSEKPFLNWYHILILYVVILFILNIIRAFDNNFWCDECFTIELSKKPLWDVLLIETEDMHPPFYHLLVGVVCLVFGYSPPVYHLISVVPYIITLVYSIIYLKREFGIHFSFIFVTMLSILYTSTVFIVEARMYEWALMFVFFTFIESYSILKYNRKKDYALFAIFLVFSSYTHYFSLMASWLIAISLFVYFIAKKDKVRTKSIVLSGIVALLLYSPWFYYFISIVGAMSKVEEFWADEIPPFLNVVAYLFFNPVVIVFISIVVIVGLYIFYRIHSTENKKTDNKISTRLIPAMNIDDNGWTWLIVGLVAIFGSIVIAYLFSFFVRPMFGYRYIYPVSVISWIIVAYCISRCNYKKNLTILVLIITLSFAIPHYCIITVDDFQTNQTIEETLDCTRPYMTEDDDFILVTRHAIDWTVIGYYYPGISHREISLIGLPDDLESGKDYWLFMTEAMNKSMEESITEKGFSGYETIKLDGNIGSYDVWIYKLIT